MPDQPQAATDDLLVTSWGLVVEGYSRVLRRLQREIEDEGGLPPSWFEVLLRLARTPGGELRMSELADQVSFTSGGFTRLADRIEAAGLIQRRVCSTDRRAFLASLTEEGRRTVDRAAAIHVRGLHQHVFDHLDDDERATLERVMRRLRDRPAEPPA